MKKPKLTKTQEKRKRKFVNECKHVIKEEFIEPWLHRKNKAFGGKRPIDLIISNDMLPLDRMIYELASGEPIG